MTPTILSERMCKRGKKKCPIRETLVTIPYKGSRKKTQKEKLKFELCLFGGMSFPHPLALHLRAEAQYDNLCNYLVPHIYNQGNIYNFLFKKIKIK